MPDFFLKQSPSFRTILFVFFFISACQVTTGQNFTKVTAGSYVNDGGASRSVNFIDYDSDGDLDLYVSNGKRYGQKSFLYQNNGGSFTRIFSTGPVNDSLPFDGSSWADFDNDGNPDMCTVTWYDSISVLYKNNGGGSFTFLGNSPIVSDRGFSETCSWGDYDNDGLVDLFLTNSRFSGSRNRLYKNLGSGNFARIDSGAIFQDVGLLSRGVNWVDIDGDRDLDLFVANESGATDYMYKNNGNGYFAKITGIAPTTSGGISWSSSWGDYDNDGDFDLFVANNENQKNFLFRNDGNFAFTRILNDTIVNEAGYHACSGWGDYDNDGDLDMYVTQAYGPPNNPLKNKLYKNLLMESGTPSFEKISTGDITNDLGFSYGFAWADWDGDGDLDLFTAKTFNENENNAAYLNDGNSNKWLEIKLHGNATNRSAIGSNVKVRTVINGNPVWLTRAVEGQSGYCGQNLDLHFGLGNAGIIDSIRVEWQSGAIDSFVNVNTNQILTIVEGQGIIGIQPIGNEVPEGFNLYQNFPNPFNPATKIKFDLPAANNASLVIYDAGGREVAVIVNQRLSAGKYEVRWNAGNYSSGIYFYKLTAGSYTETMKMVLVK
ncbi:MAG: FG-GAP-like repeat-containing protein [Ignavibacteria bacterium]